MGLLLTLFSYVTAFFHGSPIPVNDKNTSLLYSYKTLFLNFSVFNILHDEVGHLIGESECSLTECC